MKRDNAPDTPEAIIDCAFKYEVTLDMPADTAFRIALNFFFHSNIRL